MKCSFKALSFIFTLALLIYVITICSYTNEYHVFRYYKNYFSASFPYELYIIKWNRTNNISCHQETEHDALPLLTSDFTPPPKSIYFHETSCRGGFNSREACAVESAARAHPNWNVYLLFLGPVTKHVLERSCLSILLSYENIEIYRIHIQDYAKGTPIESFFNANINPISKSTFRVEHTSDSLRYLSLYKYGGVYMDTDVLVVKSFDTLVNDWTARESKDTINSAFLAFSRGTLGRKIANATIMDFKMNYQPQIWGNNGPGVITRVVENMCMKNKDGWISGCDGFVVYDPEVFYPVYYVSSRRYFEDDDTLTFTDRTYAHHLWNKISSDYKVPPNSTYANLARQYCPKVYAMYGDKFGE